MAHGHLLYVEDDSSQHEIVASVLAIEGYEVTVASSAKAALEELATRRYSVLITDYHLADAAASWLLERGRAEGLLWGVVVVVVTGERGPVETYGAPVFRKPIPFAALLSTVRAALERRPRMHSGVHARVDPSPSRLASIAGRNR